ncbi:serine/threonine-protein kinase RIO1-like [Haliotis rubra]|uniref:serine/threonine-protein kinase RIO1-like n=1 Tax=Haliotis rubra TaxID=36100 RepID=UPI001EE56B6C|nr:serine/threonine-protein kinase RIO1-like [Haliotis rubra]
MGDTTEGQFEDAEEEIIREPKIVQVDTTVEHQDGMNGEDYEDSDESDDDDFGYDFEGEHRDFTKKYNASHSSRPNAQQPNQQAPSKNKVHFQPSEKSMRKYVNKINVEKYYGPKLSSSAVSSLTETGKKLDADRYRGKDKADRATAEQVMDPRTRMILFKLLSRGFIVEINGCISTGKEANVYHAEARDGPDRAVKVYKTSILVFKDRDKYVSGEFRFRHGYCKSNPRKMVRTWAEKEMRNLIRIHQAGINCPEPLLLRSHVLVMEFIGTDGWPAPLLKDVELSESKARELYLDCIHMVRKLYHDCHLVHADLSEFNLLFHEGKLCVIDVSQAVEHDHPHSLEFLRKDCNNITEYFRKKGVSAMTVKELFDFVTDMSITDDNIDDYLDKAMAITASRTLEDVTEQEKIDEEVFKNAYIPRTLDQVIDFERDFRRAQTGDVSQVLYSKVTGLKEDLTGPQQDPDVLSKDEDVESEGDGSSSGSADSEEEDGNNLNTQRPRDESPGSKKERKKAVKEAQREKRKTKVPKKHVKKRKEKIGQQRNVKR